MTPTNQSAIRGWCLQHPRPATIRITAGDVITPLLVQPGQSWATVAKSIVALTPDLIEALDTNGNLIRAVRCDDDDGQQQEDKSAELAEAQEELERQRRVSLLDAESARFEQFARLIAEAYKHSTNVAFDKLVQMMEALNRRGESLERSLESTERMLRRAWQENVDIQAEAAEAAASDPLSQMIAAVGGGIQQGAAEAAASKPTNGKA